VLETDERELHIDNLPSPGHEFDVSSLPGSWLEVDARFTVNLGLLLDLSHRLVEEVLHRLGCWRVV